MSDHAFLIDTHVLWWWENGIPGKISAAARKEIERVERDSKFRISVMSIWEVGLLDAKGRLTALPDALTWTLRALAVPGRALVPLTPEIAIASSHLPDAPVGDPMDRIIVATARVENMTLVTADRKLLEWGRRNHLKVLAV